jgi:4-diphosphocytidyl-2-C-methyl-D-erythritol kinase
MITTVAPAKINWTLEVLRRREDGYHEVRTVMQTIDLCDEVSADTDEGLTIARNTPYASDEDDLVAKAAHALAKQAGVEARAAISVRKRIPVGAGMGGGSSDAAAALRVLREMWGVDIMSDALSEVAVSLGSDVAFFLRGGTAVAEGRGERVTAMPDVATTWLVLLVPPLGMAEKTRRMYGALQPGDFSTGSGADTFLAHVKSGRPLGDAPLCNAFERAAYQMFEGLAFFRDALTEAGARTVRLCGAGPSLFCVASGEEEARAMRARVARVRRGEKVHVVRTLGAAEATAMWS